MVPIYDTDVAEERYSKAEWEHYELWEKVEQRLRRARRLWILGTILLFITLFALPIIWDKQPKWRSLAAARRLGQEISALKREASLHHSAHRIRFEGGGSLAYRIERSATCNDTEVTIERTGNLVSTDGFALLDRKQGEGMALPGLLQDFCYDALTGSEPAVRGESLAGFGIVPVQDLLDGRVDRIAILLLTGPSAEVAFD